MKDAMYKEFSYLSEHYEYDEDELRQLYVDLNEALIDAKKAGYSKPYVKFQSTMEPYEEYLGPVSVEIWGERELSKTEEIEQKRQDTIERFAQEKGITFYEANILLSLQERGKI